MTGTKNAGPKEDIVTFLGPVESIGTIKCPDDVRQDRSGSLP